MGPIQRNRRTVSLHLFAGDPVPVAIEPTVVLHRHPVKVIAAREVRHRRTELLSRARASPLRADISSLPAWSSSSCGILVFAAPANGTPNTRTAAAVAFAP